MNTKNATTDLDERIVMLQAKKAGEWEELKKQFEVTKESLRPMNLVKGVFQDITSSPDIKKNIVGNVVGLATGYLSKKIVFGGTHNPLKKIAGAILQFAVTNFVGKKMEKSAKERTEEQEQPLSHRSETQQPISN
ncbi:MAG TPA: hypothetical protein PLS51_08235 [Flavobacterium sp.]|jgi:hypothetical protein|nr:hypothetical protein [Flavobacterium sp.]HPJ10603.1 hypothetical protein [Flavobacterium sp.]